MGDTPPFRFEPVYDRFINRKQSARPEEYDEQHDATQHQLPGIRNKFGRIGLDELEARLDEGEVEEIILATNTTVEGEVTAHYISEMAHQRGIRTTRIAHGVPVGGELEYADANTLVHAFEGRKNY